MAGRSCILGVGMPSTMRAKPKDGRCQTGRAHRSNGSPPQLLLQIARVLGAVFLVIQIVLILDFMFVVNDYLVDRDACR